MSGQPDASTSNQISQTTQGDRNQTIGQVYGGIVVYVSGGQAIINSADGSVTTPTTSQSSRKLGPNPYKGLLAFDETDGDRYFGRADEIQTLWNTFRDLHNADNKPRLLPIYGPSGSGKSSLARAGLLPELGRRPLPGRGQARVAVLVPGSDPLYSLAVALAKVATEAPNPVDEARAFEKYLTDTNDSGDFTGLNRIAFGLPNIATFPLIILVDQFEEIYAYEPKGNSADDQQKREKFIERRDAFIKNLLFAASDSSQYVSVIITCRSDFLGDTQRYPEFNKLFSTQGFLVPIMQPDDLATAIAEPAKRAGYDFDPATVQLLVEQTRGYQGALPLLQFALQRIWEGLEQGYEPLDTLNKIGGVGGALAEEAQKLYHSLSKDEKAIAPRIFVALVQIGETNELARRRARTAELITSDTDVPQVEAIIKRFAAPGVRFLVTSFTKEDGEVIEVAHEALIHNWMQLQEWVEDCRDALRKKHKIEQAAQDWEKQGYSPGYLLEGKPLRDAYEFIKSQEKGSEVKISRTASYFLRKSSIKRRRKNIKYGVIFSIFPLIGTLIALHFYILGRANLVLWNKDCVANPDVSLLLRYMSWSGQKDNLEEIHLCSEEISNIDLSKAELLNANFEEAVLQKVNFKDSFLRGANFEKSILSSVDFDGASLEEAVFKKALLYEVSFIGARNLSEEQIAEANLCRTMLPETFQLPPNRDCEKLGLPGS
ncbi:MAG: pentapeptide repeat-containing protein [Cyanobacteria bacterium P01_F01_bin.56]